MNNYRMILLLLLTVSIGYNIILLKNNYQKNSAITLSEKSLKGQVLWQKNNCTSCHQLYGLGGYLGPDLTNVMSNPKKGKQYVKAFLNSGIKSMPKFNFSEEEKNNIVAFLKAVDKTGYYPNKKAKFNKTGWVEIEYKK